MKTSIQELELEQPGSIDGAYMPPELECLIRAEALRKTEEEN